MTKNVAPETPMPIVAIHVELVRDGGGLFAPELRLAGYRAWRDGVPNPVGTADFEWLSARLSACPVRWPIEGRLALRPCALFDLGELVARGHDNEGGGEQHRVLWTALGGAVRGEALAWDPIVLEIEAAGIGPLHRDRFYFDPNVTVHRVGVGFQAAVGAGVRFP